MINRRMMFKILREMGVDTTDEHYDCLPFEYVPLNVRMTGAYKGYECICEFDEFEYIIENLDEEGLIIEDYEIEYNRKLEEYVLILYLERIDYDG